ncbi:MAG: FKBP-type peptidyl-prolyl cis-trans isomerase [Planctomycetota bacterium]
MKLSSLIVALGLPALTATTTFALTGACAVATDDPAIPADTEVVQLPSGLAYCMLASGAEGAETPAMGDLIRAHYTGWTTDGKMFDSSRNARRPGAPVEPLTIALGDVVEGWNEGLQYCPVGGRIKLTIPSALGYGDQGSGPIPGGATLIFDIELLEIVQRALPHVAWPTDEAAIETSESGLAWTVLKAGEGEVIGARTAVVDFALRNEGGGFVAASPSTNVGPLVLGPTPARFRFLTEAAQHMRAGSRVLFRVPPGLAFGDRELPNLPAGSHSLWQLEVRSLAPEFTLPSDDELTTTPSGLKYKVLREGTGKQPKASSSVNAHYTGWLTDGKKFDSSWDRGAPIDFSLTGVVAGWTEGLQLMKEGGRILLVVPPSLGYGARGKGSVPGNATMVFIVDLMKTN